MGHIPVVLVQNFLGVRLLFDFVWYQSRFLKVNLWLRLSCAEHKVDKSSGAWRKELSVLFICSCTFAFKISACRWDMVNAAPSLLDLLTFLKWEVSEMNSAQGAQALVKEMPIPWCFSFCLRIVLFSWWFWGFCSVLLQWEIFPPAILGSKWMVTAETLSGVENWESLLCPHTQAQQITAFGTCKNEECEPPASILHF